MTYDDLIAFITNLKALPRSEREALNNWLQANFAYPSDDHTILHAMTMTCLGKYLIEEVSCTACEDEGSPIDPCPRCGKVWDATGENHEATR